MLLSLFSWTALLAAAPLQPPKRPYDVQHYEINVALQTEGTFQATTNIRLKPLRALNSFDLDAFGLKVHEVLVNGLPARFILKENPSDDTGTLTIHTSQALARAKEAHVSIGYTGRAGTANQGLFIVKTTDDAAPLPYFFTHFEPNYAQQFFPNNDTPHDKATSEVWVTADSRYEILSNGEKVSDEVFQENGASLRKAHWKQTSPHSSYLIALAVGQFEPVAVSSDISSTLWVPLGTSDRALYARDFTQTALSWEEHFLGVKYPWPKYDQVAVPRFLFGGMENTSLVMMRENGLLLEDKHDFLGRPRIQGLIAHELAHQWFGNLVTCETWADIWLNEGFASYLADATVDAFNENDEIEVGNAESSFLDYFRHEDGPRAQALGARKGSAAEVFDAVSYQKGAHVLRMLEALLGRNDFQRALKNYLETYAFGNATSKDFFHSLIKTTRRPRDLAAFQDAWLNQKGYPVLTPSYTYAQGKLTVTLRQTPNRKEAKGPFVFPLKMVFNRASHPAYRETREVIVHKPVVQVTFDLPAPVEWVNWNEGGTALVRIPFNAVNEQEWLAAARNEKDSVWRLLAYFSLLERYLQDASVQAPLLSPHIMEVVREGLTSDVSPYVREALLRRVSNAKRRLLPNEWARTVLQLAKAPQGLPDDSLGTLRVKRAALETLGRFRTEETRAYLLERVEQPRIDINEVAGLAIGTARLGDSIALLALQGAINQQERRGEAYYKAAIAGLGSAETVEVLPIISKVLSTDPTNSERVRLVLSQLRDNETLKSTPEFSSWVEQFVLGDTPLNDEVSARVLRLLDDVKTPFAQSTLHRIAQTSKRERLRESARETLRKNFPTTAQKTWSQR